MTLIEQLHKIAAELRTSALKYGAPSAYRVEFRDEHLHFATIFFEDDLTGDFCTR